MSNDSKRTPGPLMADEMDGMIVTADLPGEAPSADGLAVEHRALCHSDGSECPDGCDAGPMLPSASKSLPLSKYDVPPFSGPRYFEQKRAAPEGTSPCGICGKPVNVAEAKHAGVVIDGGARWGDALSPESAPGHMGLFYVGPDCHRRHVKREPDAECVVCGKMFPSGTSVVSDSPVCRPCGSRKTR